MARENVLRRVDEDLARGHTFVAVQRLTTLAHSFPRDLHVRERLSAVHLSTGNLVEAGRWGYLSDSCDPRAVAAFERAVPNPVTRYQALRVRGSIENLPTAIARERVAALERAAAEAGLAFPPS